MLKRLLVVFLIMGATLFYALHQKGTMESHLVGGPGTSILSKLPPAEFQTLDGIPFKVHELFNNGPVDLLIVHYWGTWCGPCEAELPELMAFIKRFEDQRGVRFLLVAVNDDVMKVKKHIKTLAIPNSSVTWLIDNKNVYRESFGTTRVPETYVFSSDKVTLRKYVGPQEWNKGLFFQTFDEFLQISTHKL